MARTKLVSLVISAVCLAVFAMVVVKGMAARERRSLEVTKALLDAGAQQVASQLAVVGDDLPALASRMSADADLGAQLVLLSKQIATLAGLAKPGERMKQLVLTQTTKVSDRLNGLRGDLAHDVDAIALLDDQGLVLLSDSPTFAIGNRVRVPQLEAQTGTTAVQAAQKRDNVETIGGNTLHVHVPDEAAAEEPAEEEPPRRATRPGADIPDNPDEAAEAPVEPKPVAEGLKPAPPPTMDDVQTEAVRSAIAVGPSKGALIVDKQIVNVGAAPILVKGKLAGVLLVERRLRSLPAAGAVDAVFMVDDVVRFGKPPEDVTVVPGSAPADAPFLLAPREVRSQVPGIGDVGVTPFFVPEGQIGIWARRFSLAGVPQASGYVFTDVSPAFAELGGLQLLTVLLAIAVFVVHGLVIGTGGLSLMRGIDRVADFMSQKHEGVGDGNRLVERDLPPALHRLARLVNKAIERVGSSQQIVSGRNARLDDVIALQDANTPVPDVRDLDFSGIGERSLDPDADVLDIMGRAPPAAKPGAPAAPFAGPAAPPKLDEGSSALMASLEELSLSLADEGPKPTFPPAAPVKPKPAPGAPAPIVPKPAGVAPAPMPAPAAVAAPAAAPVPPPPAAAPPLPPAAPSAAANSDRETHYRDVFRQFVDTRKQCGESTNDVTYDKFIVKLAQSRDAVMAKHDCTDVRFQVYVKNGKAALKATPFK